MNRSSQKRIWIGLLVASLVAAASFLALSARSDAAGWRVNAVAAGQPLKMDPKLNKLVPAALRKAGVIKSGTEADYAPFEFYGSDNRTLVGADIELIADISKVLGVKIKVVPMKFASIIPALQSKRVDIGVSSMGDYKSREKVLDFVDYFLGGTSFLVKKGGYAPAVLNDLCGHAIAVLQGTSSETMAQDSSKKCTDGGHQAIDIHSYATQNDAVLAVRSGRAEAVSADSATNGYAAKQSSGALVSTGLSVYSDRPYYGIAVPKNSTLRAAISGALKKVIASGDYLKVLTKWGIEGGAIPKPLINKGGCPC
jgi:polar amino acid transport system substrate-binding protein